MLSVIEHLTTVVSTSPLPFLVQNAPSADLYFHLVLKFDGADLSDEQAANLRKYIAGFVRQKGANIKSAAFAGDRAHLLIGLSQFCAPGTFVRELKLVSSVYAKRKLGADGFKWREKYDALTVGLSQINQVKNYISRQKTLDEQESYASDWNRLASRELY